MHEIFSEHIESAENLSAIVVDIHSCKPTDRFSQSHFKELVVKAWQKQAELVVKNPSLNLVVTNALLSIADELDITNQDVDDYLLIRLSNIEHLHLIQNKQIVEKCFTSTHEDIEFNQHESIVWEFKDTTKSEQQRYSQDKQWTVFNSVMNSVLIKKRYKELAVKIEESGTLIVTNQSLYYKNNNDVMQTKYSEIHSITPMKNGVRIQANISGSMPDTYVTGDGRFTYTLLQYAQGLNA